MALTPFLRDPVFSSLMHHHFPDEFSTLFDPPTSAFLKDSKAMMGTAVDVKETPTEFRFMADLPGLKKEEVKVQLEDGNVLSISGERTREVRQDTDKFHRMERSTGRFMRKFRLPENADLEKITATAENGVLTVNVPKVKPPEVEKPKVVDIAIA